ncbi:hypothetical protein [Deinococcus hopiensis]|nr:hypothetical protein [Deinococcus hopiensis]
MVESVPQVKPKPKSKSLPTRVWAPVLGVYAAAVIGGAYWFVQDLDRSLLLEDVPSTAQPVQSPVPAPSK